MIFSPFIKISPLVTSISPLIIFKAVVLPQPEEPTIVTNSPFSIAGSMFDVPPPTPCVISTFKLVSCSIRMSIISPRIYCSVIGLVAILIVSFLPPGIIEIIVITATSIIATKLIILLVFFALILLLEILFSINPRIKSNTKASIAISKLPTIVIAVLLVVIPL